jgi:hypothetical protein
MKIQHFCRAMLVALSLFAVSAASHAAVWSVGVSVGFPPPALPVYEQPPVPAAGYLWTPGYWAYDDEAQDYYWVPGTWVLAPRPGYLWTPGYWAADGAYFAWHAGYWGPEVGFYGGINYGFGYFGIGFGGGYWRGHDFCYNRAVTNINNVSIRNVYNNTTVVNNPVTSSRVSYNGGRGGTHVRPSGAEQAVAHAPHLTATNEQLRHESAARSIPALRSAANHGQPSIAATPKPALFAGGGLTAARGAGDVASLRGGRPYQATSPAASSSARAAALQPRPAGNAPRGDRPAWADRGGVQYAVHSATSPAAVVHGAALDRPGPSYQYSPGTRSDRPAASQAWTGPTSPRDVRVPAARNARSYYGYPAARAPAQHSTEPTHAAHDSRYAPHEPARPAYVQRAAAPPREYGRAPSYGAPHPAGNAAPPRTYSAPHGDGPRHGPLHS